METPLLFVSGVLPKRLNLFDFENWNYFTPSKARVQKQTIKKTTEELHNSLHCKIYKIILLNRLENYASHNQYFSERQFGYQDGVGCIEALFTILETINHMLERQIKIIGRP